jgi:predicted RND superfamily exporter protein
MIIAFRSIRLGLLCMIPNLLPAIVAFGLCGLLIGEIDMGTAMIFSMTLGIVVDDTIHFVVSYRRQRLQGQTPAMAVNNTYALVGRAIIITSLVLCIGYLIPVFTAELRMNVQMYALSVVCIATAMIADLFFLPSLLVKTDKYP